MSNKPPEDEQKSDQAEWRALVSYQEGSRLEDDGKNLEGELAELRRLLLAPEQDRLDQITERMQQLESRQRIFQIKNQERQVNVVSRVLPEAVLMHKGHDSQLAQALSPTIEETIKISVKQNPQPLVDAIFPVMGPAIRKSVREAMRSLLDTINQALEHSLSVRSIKWRIEARRSGLPFSEVLLRHTIDYRVEQLYLIDRTSGLPIQHVSAEAIKTQDSALVSGMLTAIQDFVRESFQPGSNEALDTLRMGDLVVLIEEGPKAVLAAIVRGVPPPSLRGSLQELIEKIHLQFRKELTQFSGDMTSFAGAQPLLKTGLLVEYKAETKKTSWIPRFVLTAFLIGIGVLIFFFVRERIRWNEYVRLLNSEPGIIVTESGRRIGSWYVSGLRDPLAADPAELLAQIPLRDKPIDESWARYQALEPPIVARRAAAFLEAPSTVSFIVDDTDLYISGIATPRWKERARTRIPLFVGIDTYRDGGLDTGENAFRSFFSARVDSIESKSLRFYSGTSNLVTGQDAEIDAITSELLALYHASDSLGWPTRLRIFGHASTEGVEALNRVLSEFRATTMRDTFIRADFPASSIDIVGTGEPLYPSEAATEEERQRNRSVSFYLTVDSI